MRIPWRWRSQTEFMAMRDDRDYWRELYDVEVRIHKELDTKLEQRNNQLMSLSHKLNAAVDREIRIREIFSIQPFIDVDRGD